MRLSLATLSCLFILFTPSQTQQPLDYQHGDSVALDMESSPEIIPPITYTGMTVEETEKLRSESETYQFQSEVSRVMKIIIHSLYKRKDIFLRELISNSADALDKARFMTTVNVDSSSSPSNETHLELEIRIKPDYTKNTLTITDTGIGMTRDELKNNLGTIAKSGTMQFMENLEKLKGEASDKAIELIGQFGVGFYSAFLVADKVTVVSKNDNDKQYIWESDETGFTIVEDPRNHLVRGTEITLHLKEDSLRFLKIQKLKNIIKQYSEFLAFPIHLWIEEGKEFERDPKHEPKLPPRFDRSRRPPRPPHMGPEGPHDSNWDDEEFRLRHPDFSGHPPHPEDETVTVENVPSESSAPVVTGKWEHINVNSPLWMKSPNEISEKEYNDFYRQVTRDFQDPLGHIHFKAESDITFRAILYIQSKLNREFVHIADERKQHFRLYVKRVFINDDQMNILPQYLSFVKGVIDSDDFPIDVSRETLQQSRFIQLLKRKITSKALEMIKNLSQNATNYEPFLEQYSDNLKLGILEDQRNQKKLLKLIRFKSSKSPSRGISLDKYVKRMKEGQKFIYYLAGDSLEELQKSPFVEKLLRLDMEVLYMIEPMDEFLMQRLSDYEGHHFKNVAKEGLELLDEEDESGQLEEMKIEYEGLTKWMEEKALSGLVSKVQVSNRLTTSPCAIVANKDGISGHMQRVWNNQMFNQNKQVQQRHILEVNPLHPLIKEINRQVEDANNIKRQHEQANDGDAMDDDGKGGVAASVWDTTQMLYDITALRSGYPLGNVVLYADRVESLLRNWLGVGEDEQVDLRDIVPAPEKDEGESEEESVKDDKKITGSDEEELGFKKRQGVDDDDEDD